MIIWLSLLNLACFQPFEDLSTIDTNTLPFESPHLDTDDVLIHRFESTLVCPDGEPADFFVVASESLEDNAPVAVVLHSGAFDYVMERAESGPLDGPHYQAQSRLTAEFGISKVYETLGLQVTDLDPAEDNRGTLPAALADQGMVQLIPSNCWGDLWHNEEGLQYNDIEADGFARNGLTFAWWMVRIATDPDFAAGQGVDLDISWNPEELYLLGLGDGGRGVVELLAHQDMPAVSGALIDSSPDDLSAYLDNPATFHDEIAGISRIFGSGNLEHISDWSIASETVTLDLPPRTIYLWSDGDTRLPSETMAGGAAALLSHEGAWVVNTHEAIHVISNSDLTRAHEVVDYLRTGLKPTVD
jgi:hypothetical protein